MSLGSGGRRFLVYQLPALCWAGAIFVASSISHVPAPEMGALTWDKTLHFVAFGILGFLALRAAPRARAWGVIGSMAWAGLDEIHQAFVYGRDASPYDFLADVVGIGMAYVFFLGLLRWSVHPLWTGVARGDEPGDGLENHG